MPRKQRNEESGAWHHVMNRGLARRTLFESDHDTRKFLSLLARTVRSGRLELHAYCILTTHFHLLVRSPRGELSAVMQWAMNQYVRWFNRGRRRDGPLMRSRFLSKRADSVAYRRHLVRYIDFNAVEAGLVQIPAAYPHGSAGRYARRVGPLWLNRSWIESEIAECVPELPCCAESYAELFGEPLSPSVRDWVEQRANLPNHMTDPLDELLAAAPHRVLAWMRRKAELADGTTVGSSLCDSHSVAAVIGDLQARVGEWHVEHARSNTSAWDLLRIGLRRQLCVATLGQIAAEMLLNTCAVQRLARRHTEFLRIDARYAATAAELSVAALRRCHQKRVLRVRRWDEKAVPRRGAAGM
jgi:REP element-mobilizing transposase RayT